MPRAPSKVTCAPSTPTQSGTRSKDCVPVITLSNSSHLVEPRFGRSELVWVASCMQCHDGRVGGTVWCPRANFVVVPLLDDVELGQTA